MAALNPRNIVIPGNLSVYFQNVNSWLSKDKELKYFIKNYDPEVIMLAHTNVTNASTYQCNQSILAQIIQV